MSKIKLANQCQFEIKTIDIFDVTLREGAQTPSFNFSYLQKEHILSALLDTGIRSIEAGFPAASTKEFACFKQLQSRFSSINLFAFCRMTLHDVKVAIEANARCVSLVIPSSDLNLKKKLEISVSDALKQVEAVVRFAKENNLVVRFSCEDASRTPLDRLCHFFRIAHDAGADILTFADTLGVMTPSSVKFAFQKINSVLPNAKFAIHCHNDLGLALANTLAAIESGVEQVHVTVNGIGERCGNVALEELVLVLKTHYGHAKAISAKKLYKLCLDVYDYCGLQPAVNKPVTGQNCFRHESGIHVHGLLRDPKCYEPFDPNIIGRKSEVTLGAASGKSNFEYLMREGLLPDLNPQTIELILENMKEHL